MNSKNTSSRSEISKHEARSVVKQLLSSPIAPGSYSHLINVGTNFILDTLESNYFKGELSLSDGFGCFKYLEGDYGSGKTQFILSLAQRAHENDVVSSVIDIGVECPFNSPLAIFRSVMESFLLPDDGSNPIGEKRGIEVLIDNWMLRKLCDFGIQPGQEVPHPIRLQIERSFAGLPMGAPDQQMASGLIGLGRRMLDIRCGAISSVLDTELIGWVRGEQIRSKGLRESFGLHETAKDENAFKRLKTVVHFLRTRMGYRGFFIAFDEGTRTASFRRGSIKQKQAIENMLTMINDNVDGEFGGVMFLYSATPDFRSDVISKSYTALNDRIGTIAFSAGSPMVPLIDLDAHNSDEVTMQIGERLMDVFEVAQSIKLNRDVQRANIKELIIAQKDVLFLLDKVPPRVFVYQYCRFLSQQENDQHLINQEEASDFVRENDPTQSENEE